MGAWAIAGTRVRSGAQSRQTIRNGDSEGLSVGTYRALIVGAGGMGRAWGKNLRDCEDGLDAHVATLRWIISS